MRRGAPFGFEQLSGQRRSVSQDRALYVKRHTQFCNLLWQPSVKSLTEPELLFNYSENMFHFGAYARFFIFFAFDLWLEAGVEVFVRAGPVLSWTLAAVTFTVWIKTVLAIHIDVGLVA